MSVFRTATINCPACGAALEFKVALSVNADRRPDLRAAIIDGSFQREECPKCSEPFRLAPEFTVIDVGRGQWIAVFPLTKLGHWQEHDEQARATFAQAYGAHAPAAVRAMAARMKPRIVFGWAALREKLVVLDHHLDDVNLELLKLAIVRSSQGSPLSNETELRFIDVEEDRLLLAWIRALTEQVIEVLKVPRQAYDDIAANQTGWQPLRKELSAGLFVDMNRLLVEAGKSP